MSLRILLASATLLAITPQSSSAAEPARIHVIVNIDIIPDRAVPGAGMVADYARLERRNPDILSVVLIRQAGSTNHFILDEVFTGKAGYDRHAAAPYVLRFRADLYPLLGSPWDERLGADVGP